MVMTKADARRDSETSMIPSVTIDAVTSLRLRCGTTTQRDLVHDQNPIKSIEGCSKSIWHYPPASHAEMTPPHPSAARNAQALSNGATSRPSFEQTATECPFADRLVDNPVFSNSMRFHIAAKKSSQTQCLFFPRGTTISHKDLQRT